MKRHKVSRRGSRSREGAWIEILTLRRSGNSAYCRSREGAWIEIARALNEAQTAFGRSREGAWIEILLFVLCGDTIMVAPARERGLKCEARPACAAARQSLPRGSVD